MVLETAAWWLVTQIRRDAEDRAWAGVKTLLLGSAAEKALAEATSTAMNATIQKSLGSGASADRTRRVFEVLDQLWPATEATPPGEGSILDRVESIVRGAMTSAVRPVDFGADFASTSALDALQAELGVALDADEFADDFAGRWVQAVRDRAVTEVALSELGNQLAHDLTHRAQQREDQRRLASEPTHASAVGLKVTHDGIRTMLWVANEGTHQVTAIEINAIPDDDEWHESTHGRLPSIDDEPPTGVEVVYPMTGGWLYATIDRLSPGRGLAVASYGDDRSFYDKIDFDVSWIDHEGLQRKSHAVAQLGTTSGSIPLQSRRRR